jgi:hypothetical protein
MAALNQIRSPFVLDRVRYVYLTDENKTRNNVADRPIPPESEITPEMIAAGEDVLLCELGGAVTSHWDARGLAIAVYQAMAVLGRPRNPIA